MFDKTPFHLAIENAVSTGKNVIVEAGPGSGKTTTISEIIIKAILAQMEQLDGIACAFNGKNANGLKMAINSPFVKCGTVHSIMLSDCLKANGKVQVQVESKAMFNKFYKRWMPATIDKMQALVEILFPNEVKDGFDFHLALRLVSLMKANAFGITGFPAIDDKTAINAIIASHSLSNPDEGEENDDHVNASIDYAIQLMNASNKQTNIVNYDDMLYLSLYLNLKLPSYKFIVYDEGQDIKPIELEFLTRMANKGTQIVIVGDSMQAVNHFTGCMDKALKAAQESTNAVSLPLRVSYRASILAAQLANEIFPDSVIPCKWAKQGELSELTFPELQEQVKMLDFNHGIISRTHKNLIGMALSLLANKMPFTYKGINDLVEKMGKMLYYASKEASSIEIIRKNLTEYQANIEDKFVKPNGSLPTWVSKSAETTDCLCLLLAHCQGEGLGIECVKSYLKSLSDYDKPSQGPTLTTAHASKGMQWENVYLVGEMISPLAKSDEQLYAEKCLHYVAITRSSNNIIKVSI